MTTASATAAACAALFMFAAPAVAEAASSATLFLSVKVQLADQSTSANIADGFCAARGYDHAVASTGQIVVASSGYARFASIRCERTTTPATANLAAAPHQNLSRTD